MDLRHCQEFREPTSPVVSIAFASRATFELCSESGLEAGRIMSSGGLSSSMVDRKLDDGGRETFSGPSPGGFHRYSIFTRRPRKKWHEDVVVMRSFVHARNLPQPIKSLAHQPCISSQPPIFQPFVFTVSSRNFMSVTAHGLLAPC
jgi:hypothetical protein